MVRRGFRKRKGEDSPRSHFALLFAIVCLFASTQIIQAAPVSVLTYHNDTTRTGQNTNETVLTPANVNTNSFGLLFTYPVDGYVYAQPLVLANVTIPSNGVHNVVYVATEHDSVYAFDADSDAGSNAAPLWQVSFINPSAGITSVSNADVGCMDLVPEIGITSTPVIDPVSGTLYVEAKTKEVVTNVASYVHRLHALDVTTGAEKFGGPVVIQATVPGTGDGSDGFGNMVFNSQWQMNRAALLLDNGTVYVAFGSHCDNPPFHGWLFAFNAATLATNGVFLATPNGDDGGIWQAGGGPACDTNGFIFLATGNGTFDATNGEFGDSILKISTNSLMVQDFFTPFNQQILNTNDLDLASGGTVLLPDEAGSLAHPHLLVGAGKQGTIYLVDRDNMGQFDTGGDTQIVESIQGAIGSCFSTPAYFNNTLYFVGANDIIRAFAINNGSIDSIPVSQGLNELGWPGCTPSISANGTNNPIAWTIQSEAFHTEGPTILHAFDATDLDGELYNSSQAGARDIPGAAVKFTVPTVANGKVYVGTESTLAVFGIGTFLATPTISPNGGTFSNSVMITLSDTTPGAAIYFTLDNTTPTTNSLLYTVPFSVTNYAVLSAQAFMTGAVDSAVATASFTITPLLPPTASFTGSPRTGFAPLTVTFSDTSTGTVTNRAWTFGDGGTTNTLDTTVVYTYDSISTNTVTLIVSGPLGARTNMVFNYITISPPIPPAPVAAFSASPTNGSNPLLVNFTDASTGMITNHAWTFGDGGTSSLASPSYTYSNSGVYSVALTVSGPGGSGITNLANLITVTNLAPVPPTVNILRPGNGMLYPPVTNLTIMVVADAISNDSTPITKLEFFADGTKFGETTSNPGTNLLLNPTLGSHAITARATDTLGATNTSPAATITIGAKNSPLGNWETTISGGDKGAQFLNFQDDFTASAYGIRLKTFGRESISGTWSFNAKGQVTGPFLGEIGLTNNWTGTMLGTAKSLKSFSAIVPTTAFGTFHWKGITATTSPDLSGTWTGLVTVVKTPAAVSYVLIPDTNTPGVFDIATSLDPSTTLGEVLVTSKNKVYGYFIFNSQPITMSGTVNVKSMTMSLTGMTSTAEKVKIKIVR